MRRLFIAMSAAFLVGCADNPTEPEVFAPGIDVPIAPALSVVDGAHDGLAGFYFMPPLVASMPQTSGTFDNSLVERLAVTVCELEGDVCAPEGFARTFDHQSGTFLNQVRLFPNAQYLVYWATAPDGLQAGTIYRATVLLDGIPLGHADINVVASLAEYLNVDRSQYAAAIPGMTLPMGFRVEEGIRFEPLTVFEADPSVLALTSTEAEIAEGRFRFQRPAGPDQPSPEVGEVLLVSERGGHIRRVVSVAEVGGEVVVETEFVSVAEVVRDGAFETQFVVAAAAPGPTGVGPVAQMPSGGVRVSPVEARYLAPGITLGPEAIDVSGLDLCEEFLASQCPEGVELTLSEGRIEFEPSVEIDVDIGSFSLESFRAEAIGTLTYDVQLEGRAASSFTADGETLLAELSWDFFISPTPTMPIPVWGTASVSLTAGYEAAASVEALYRVGFNSQHTARAGAQFQAGAWSPIFEFDRDAEVLPPDFSGNVAASARVFVQPEVSIELYSVAGPFMGLTPDVTAEGTWAFENEIQSCDFTVVGALDAYVGFDVTILDDEVGRFETSLGSLEWLRVERGSDEFYRLEPVEGAGPGDDANTHVVFIHGLDLLYPTCPQWLFFDGQEQAKTVLSGMDEYPEANQWLFTYPTYHPLLAAGDALAAELAARFSPSDRVILVGYSMGGLVGRDVLDAWPENQQLVDGLITLGTPHTGTPLAEPLNWVSPILPLFGTAGVADMATGSDYLGQLPDAIVPTMTFAGRAERTLGEILRPPFDVFADLLADAGPHDLVVPEVSAHFLESTSPLLEPNGAYDAWSEYDHFDLARGLGDGDGVDPIFSAIAAAARSLGTTPRAPTDLVAHYPFDNGAAEDLAAANDGEFVGAATGGTDRFGNPVGANSGALRLDGSGGHVRVDHQPWLNLGDDFTLSAWVRSEAQSGAPNHFVIAKGTSVFSHEYALYLTNGENEPSFSVDTESSSNRHLSTNVPIPTTAWTHLALVAQNGVAQVYINGDPVPSPAGTDAFDYRDSEADLFFGFLSPQSYRGSIDEVRIYDRALVLDEVQALCDVDAICESAPQGGDLVGYYPFSGNANDESGFGVDGVVVGPTLSADRFGNAGSAFSFDGVDDYIEIPTSAQMEQLTDEITISAWVRRGVASLQESFVISRRLGSNPGIQHTIKLSPSGEISFQWTGAGQPSVGLVTQVYENGFGLLNDGNWHHLAVSYRFGPAGGGSIYVDGRALDTFFSFGSDGTSVPSSVVAPTRIGDQISESPGRFRGMIDDVRVYRRALTDQEVVELCDVASICDPVAVPSVTTRTPDEVQRNSFEARGRATSNGAATQVWFEWGRSETLATFEETPRTNLAPEASGQQFERTIDGLQQNTEYFYRAVAENSEGVTRGEIRDLTTASAVLPDLVVVDNSRPTSVQPGATYAVTVDVENQGGPMEPGRQWLVRFYLSTDSTISPSDTLLDTDSMFTALTQGTSVTADGTITIPSNWPSGTSFIGVIIDATDQIEEADEGNNVDNLGPVAVSGS